MGDNNSVLPARSTTTLRTLGSLTRFRADKPVPKSLVELLHAHLISEWQPMLDLLATFKMVVLDGSRVYLTPLGAETAAKLTSPLDADFDSKDLELLVTRATNLPCFAQSFDSENSVCMTCPVQVLCRESHPTHLAEVGFALQHADEEERKRIEAAEEARKRQEAIEQAREQREQDRLAARSLGELYAALRASAPDPESKESQGS